MIGNPKNSHKQKIQVSYYSKISTISTYFGVSDSAAKYMYHLRRKGFPFRKPDKQDYLNWTIPLQNALVLADTYEHFDWSILQFGDEIDALMRHGIEVNYRDQRIFRNEISQDTAAKTNVNVDDVGWTVVVFKYNALAEKHIVRNCGLLPIRTRNNRVKKKNSRKNDELPLFTSEDDNIVDVEVTK
jgi:hypothetical protein